MGFITGTGRPGVDLPKQTSAPTPKSRRPVYLGSKQGFAELPVSQGDGLAAALTEGPTTTILLLKGQTAITDAHRNYLVELIA